jgi:hypothetical protein
MALVTILSGATAIPAYALDVGVDGNVDAGVSGAVDSAGTIAATTDADVNTSASADTKTNADSTTSADANTGANVDADVAVDTQDATDTVGAATNAATAAAVGVQVGTPVMSADGQLIGQVEATRETDDGHTQAVISIDESADLSAEKIAIDVERLKKDADGAMEFGRSMTELRAGIKAQADGNS